jgi:hypothetical protein
MRPVIDVLFSTWRGEKNNSPVAFIRLKHYFGMGDFWPEAIQKERMLSLDCLSIEELRHEASKLKQEIDEAVIKAEKHFRKKAA